MITDEELNDLESLKNLNDKLAQDFCKLSIDSMKEDINSRTYISAANKLNLTIIQIQKVTHALISILLKAQEKDLKEEELKELLVQVNLPDNIAQSISDVYRDNRALLKENLRSFGLKVLEYEDLNWRFDILSKTRTLNEVLEPIVTVQLKLKDESSQTLQEHHMQVDPNTMIHMTECLEQALQQARLHHARKFKKQKRTT